MSDSNFSFLRSEWLDLHDTALRLPYQDNLSALIHEPTFKATAGVAVFAKMVLINRLGNSAVHGHRAVPQFDALTAVRELFHVVYWLAHTYARGAKPPSGLVFNPDRLKPGLRKLVVPPSGRPAGPQTQEQLQRLETELRERDEKLSALLADKTALSAELTRLRVQVAEAKKANATQADTHDYSEAETRDYLIDLLLKEAGWALDQERDREFPWRECPTTRARASWITCSGAMTASRSR